MITMSPKWKTVKISAVLADQIDALLEARGYKSRSDWVSETIRQRLATLSKTPPKKQKLSEEEEDMLSSWALSMKLEQAEERDIRRLLLENAHVWKWLRPKLEDAVAFVLELKKN